MRKSHKTKALLRPQTLRCAVYTRKSSEEGLERDFNSLDAQREACEAFIRSQKHEGWICLPEFYDDGGISGGTIERIVVNRLRLFLSDSGQVPPASVFLAACCRPELRTQRKNRPEALP